VRIRKTLTAMSLQVARAASSSTTWRRNGWSEIDSVQAGAGFSNGSPQFFDSEETMKTLYVLLDVIGKRTLELREV